MKKDWYDVGVTAGDRFRGQMGRSCWGVDIWAKPAAWDAANGAKCQDELLFLYISPWTPGVLKNYLAASCFFLQEKYADVEDAEYLRRNQHHQAQKSLDQEVGNTPNKWFHHSNMPLGGMFIATYSSAVSYVPDFMRSGLKTEHDHPLWYQQHPCPKRSIWDHDGWRWRGAQLEMSWDHGRELRSG